ncbi:MAG: hypothetical protein ABWZ01_02240, partial [Methyloceanibacter sp.]
LFANPEQAGETVRQLGDAIQKKFKGKPVGEALGRFLGNVEIKRRGGGDAAPPARRAPTAPGLAPATPPEDSDPQVDNILR